MVIFWIQGKASFRFDSQHSLNTLKIYCWNTNFLSMSSKYDHFELISFHSISKGVIGECGRRGGYYQCEQIDPLVMEQLYKLASISLCPNVQGQVMVNLMVRPPVKGDPSWDLYHKETSEIFGKLNKRLRVPI